MTIAILIILLLGGGTSLAAEGAAPGEALYSVKVSINEPIRGALAFTDEADVEWQARLMERRLEEAERLSVRAKLDAQARVEIETRLAVHAKAFEDKAKELKEQGRADSALEARSELESRLKAHTQVLAAILERTPDARIHGDPILSRVQSNIAASVQARAEAEAELATKTGPDVRAAAEGKRSAAENKRAEVRRVIDRMRASVEGTVIASAESRMSASDAAFTRGEAQLIAGEFGKAFVSFEESMRVVQEAKILVVTSDRTRVNAAGSLKMGSDGTDADDTSGSGSSLEEETDAEEGTGVSNAERHNRVRLDIGL